jgi:hypothetical protein
MLPRHPYPVEVFLLDAFFEERPQRWVLVQASSAARAELRASELALGGRGNREQR